MAAAFILRAVIELAEGNFAVGRRFSGGDTYAVAFSEGSV
jgi:hypothetical protein